MINDVIKLWICMKFAESFDHVTWILMNINDLRYAQCDVNTIASLNCSRLIENRRTNNLCYPVNIRQWIKRKEMRTGYESKLIMNEMWKNTITEWKRAKRTWKPSKRQAVRQAGQLDARAAGCCRSTPSWGLYVDQRCSRLDWWVLVVKQGREIKGIVQGTWSIWLKWAPFLTENMF